MKTLLLAAVLAALGTPALAQSGNYGNREFGNHGSNYRNTPGYQNNGHSGYSNGHPGTGYNSGLNHGTGYGRGYSTPDPWAHRSVAPAIRTRGMYDPLHGDFHPNVNLGYGSSFNRPGLDHRYRGHGGYGRD